MKKCAGCKKKRAKGKSKFCDPKCGQKHRQIANQTKNPRLWMYYRIKAHAKLRKIKFNLEKKDIPEIPKHCPVFRWVELHTHYGEGRKFFADSPSVDRIYNERGYVKGNIRIISWWANMLKGHASLKEYRAIVEDAERLELLQ